MMNNQNPKSETSMSRRGFLAGAGRYLTAGGLLAGVSALVFKRHDECVKASACDMCGLFGECRLDQAIETRSRRSTLEAA